MFLDFICCTNIVKEIFICKGFTIVKISQMKKCRNRKLIPFYLIELPKNVASLENFCSIFSLWVEIENFRPAEKARNITVADVL